MDEKLLFNKFLKQNYEHAIIDLTKFNAYVKYETYLYWKILLALLQNSYLLTHLNPTQSVLHDRKLHLNLTYDSSKLMV